MKRIEDARLAEERLQESYLIAFRATPEELALRKAQDAKGPRFPDNPFAQRAEETGLLAREGVRFNRYLVRQGYYPAYPKKARLG